MGSAPPSRSTLLLPLLLLGLSNTLGAAASTASSQGPAATYASFRKDYYLADSKYPELFTKNPIHGGRVHIVGPAVESQYTPPYNITLPGASACTDPVNGPDTFGDNFDWLHVDVNGKTKQVAVSFHTHSDTLAPSLKHVRVVDSLGKTVIDEDVELPSDESTFPLAASYVTTTANFTSYVIHVHNFGTQTYNVTSVVLDGKIAGSVEPFSLGAGEHVVLKVPTPPGATLADVWTLGLHLASGQRIGYGGRIVREIFPIADWPKAEDCPFPLANASNYNLLRQTLHIDTHFTGKRQCDTELVDTLHDAAKRAGTDQAYFVMADEGSSEDAKHIPEDAAAAIIALSTGDESDKSVDNAPPTWSISRDRRARYPWTVQFLGGHSHKFIGTFAGIADIQSTDFYVGACAPHITAAIAPMHLQGAYDYIRNMRNNHMPLTSWGYSQAFEVWKTGIGIPTTLKAGEVTAQIASVVAAGGKGIQLFQSQISLYQTDIDAWRAAGELLGNIKAVRELIREGDVDGAIFSKDDANRSLVSVIAVEPRKLVVVAINTNANGYSDLTCYLGISNHWKFQPHTIGNLNITLPGTAGTPSQTTVEEAVQGKIAPAQGLAQHVAGAKLVLSNIALGTENVARIFVVSWS